MNLVDASLKDIVHDLIKSGVKEESVVILNDELVLVNDRLNAAVNKKTLEMSKLYPEFTVYNRLGVVLPVQVNLVAEIVLNDGIRFGYLFEPAKMCSIESICCTDIMKDIKLPVIISDSKMESFKCNSVTDDILMNSCVGVDDTMELYYRAYNYILKLDNVRFTFNNSVWQTKLNSAVKFDYSCVGKFVETI